MRVETVEAGRLTVHPPNETYGGTPRTLSPRLVLSPPMGEIVYVCACRVRSQTAKGRNSSGSQANEM